MKLAGLLLTLAAAASAADFTGSVVDLMCRGKDLADHTRECAVTCAKSGYGMLTTDGRFLKFDETGNARTLAALKKSTKEKDLKVKVTGRLSGDILKVQTIELQ